MVGTCQSRLRHITNSAPTSSPSHSTLASLNSSCGWAVQFSSCSWAATPVAARPALTPADVATSVSAQLKHEQLLVSCMGCSSCAEQVNIWCRTCCTRRCSHRQGSACVWQQFHCGQNASCLPLLRRSHGRRPPTQGVPRCAEGAQTFFSSTQI